jgi:hypothetical protein
VFSNCMDVVHANVCDEMNTLILLKNSGNSIGKQSSVLQWDVAITCELLTLPTNSQTTLRPYDPTTAVSPTTPEDCKYKEITGAKGNGSLWKIQALEKFRASYHLYSSIGSLISILYRTLGPHDSFGEQQIKQENREYL